MITACKTGTLALPDTVCLHSSLGVVCPLAFCLDIRQCIYAYYTVKTWQINLTIKHKPNVAHCVSKIYIAFIFSVKF